MNNPLYEKNAPGKRYELPRGRFFIFSWFSGNIVPLSGFSKLRRLF